MNNVGRFGVIVSVLCLATAGSVGRGENLVPNPGFETGTTDGWDGEFAVTSAESHTGGYSAALGEALLQFDAIPLKRIDAASFWIKYESLSSFAYYSVWCETRTGQKLLGAVPLQPYTLDWCEHGIGMGTNPDWVVKGVTLGGWGAFVDDVQILLNAQQVEVNIGRYVGGRDIPLDGVFPFSATILGSSVLDIHDVDRSSLTLDGTAAMCLNGGDVIATEKDVNGDGFMDLGVSFCPSELAYSPDVVTAELSGRLLDGTEFFGTDAIHLAVPEPASVSLVGLGGLAMIRRRRRARL